LTKESRGSEPCGGIERLERNCSGVFVGVAKVQEKIVGGKDL